VQKDKSVVLRSCLPTCLLHRTPAVLQAMRMLLAAAVGTRGTTKAVQPYAAPPLCERAPAAAPPLTCVASGAAAHELLPLSGWGCRQGRHPGAPSHVLAPPRIAPALQQNEFGDDCVGATAASIGSGSSSSSTEAAAAATGQQPLVSTSRHCRQHHRPDPMGQTTHGARASRLIHR